jgi:hypothetical protein
MTREGPQAADKQIGGCTRALRRQPGWSPRLSSCLSSFCSFAFSTPTSRGGDCRPEVECHPSVRPPTTQPRQLITSKSVTRILNAAGTKLSAGWNKVGAARILNNVMYPKSSSYPISNVDTVNGSSEM